MVFPTVEWYGEGTVAFAHLSHVTVLFLTREEESRKTAAHNPPLIGQ